MWEIDGIIYEDDAPEAIAAREAMERAEAEEEAQARDAQRRKEAERQMTTGEFFERYVMPVLIPNANKLDVPDEDAARLVRFYPEWVTGKNYLVGYRVRDGDSLYRCLKVHTSVKGHAPHEDGKLWEVM